MIWEMCWKKSENLRKKQNTNTRPVHKAQKHVTVVPTTH